MLLDGRRKCAHIFPVPTKKASANLRNGKPLAKLKRGDRRRLNDGRNAWRHMTAEQRGEFVAWIQSENLPIKFGDSVEAEDLDRHCPTCLCS